MRLFKLIIYDMKNGFWKSKWRLCCIVIIVLISCIDFYIRKSKGFYFEEMIPSGTFGDYICYLLGGIPEYNPGADKEFIFPVKWFLFHLTLLYGTLHYSVHDLYSVGNIMLPRCDRRSFWWLSKCIWNIAYIVLAYILSFGTVFVFCIVTGEKTVLPITSEFVNALMEAESPFMEFPIQFSVMLLIVPCLFSIGNSLFLLLLTLFLKPVLSYGIMIVFFLCGAYFNMPVFWESMTMGFRSEWVMEGGYSAVTALLAAGIIITGTIVIGHIKFQKHDILNLNIE